MILHLHTDSRFSDYTISLFNSAATKHIVGKRYPGQAHQYISEINKKKTINFVFGWSSETQLIRTYNPSMVVVHYLDPRWSNLILKLSSKVKIVWIFWGADGYNLPKMRNNLYDPYSQKFQTGSSNSGIAKLKADLRVKSVYHYKFFASLFFEFLVKIQKKRIGDFQEKVFDRVDYCGTFLREDYELLTRTYPFKMQWVDARFISLEKLVGNQSDHFASGSNILLGNSCTIENNHLDAILMLREISFQEKMRVICPLNYGKDLGNYSDEVCKVGSNALGEKFTPLLEHLALVKYTELLLSCSYAVMYHNRQQAFNNILALIYLGVKVYLKPENTIFQFLRRIGCVVGSVKDLIDTGSFSPLSMAEKSSNRAILLREFSDKMIAKSAKSIEQLLAD